MKQARPHCHGGKRPLRTESLEPRIVLTGSVIFEYGDWHNESRGTDVDANGYTTPLDALGIIRVLTQFEAGPIREIQDAWRQVDPDAIEITGGFLPDVDNDGIVGPLDALAAVNQLPSSSGVPAEDTVAVMPDSQGRPTSVIYKTASGFTTEFAIGRFDGVNSVTWQGGNVDLRINANVGAMLPAEDPAILTNIIAKPGIGVLVGKALASDRMATVTRFTPDGMEVVEQYLCVPLIDLPGATDPIELPPDDPRTPIEGFEEAVGAIVSREFHYKDGGVAAETYRDDFSEVMGMTPAERLLTISVEFGHENTLTIDVAASSQTVAPTDLPLIRENLRQLLTRGEVPTNTTMTLEEYADAVATQLASD